MACHQTCVDIGKRCNYSVRRSSCTDCGKVGECSHYISSNFVCPCENKTSGPTGYDPQAADNKGKGTTENRYEKLSSSTKTPVSKPNECGKQTFWQWLLSLIGLGKKNEDCKNTDGNKKDPTSELIQKTQIKQELVTSGKDGIESVKKQEKPEDKQRPSESPPAIQTEHSPGDKAADLTPVDKKVNKTRKRRRSQSADSKSRNKYLGRPLEPSPPVKRRSSTPNKGKKFAKSHKASAEFNSKKPNPTSTNKSPTSPGAAKTVSQSPCDKPQKETGHHNTSKPPISPVYSSEKYLRAYKPTCQPEPCPCPCSPCPCSPCPCSPCPPCPPQPPCPCPHQPQEPLPPCAKQVNKTTNERSTEQKCLCADSFEEAIRSMSCPSPCCISPCVCPPPLTVCCSPNPCCSPNLCCDPSITTLMRKRCPPPSKVCKKRSKSCTSPRCVNECSALFKKDMKHKRRPNVCQVCCTSPFGNCCTCGPVKCKEMPCSPAPCTVKCQCCPQTSGCCKSPTMCDYICQPPCSLRSNLPPTTSSYGKCPITCMRPCCVPIPVAPFSNCCPPTKPACPSPGCSPTAKAHTACSIPKATMKHPFPPSCSTFCSPNSLKSYAKSKDGDAYCKFLMSRYNVSVPDYPPLLPMTLSGCSPMAPVLAIVHDFKPTCYANKCGGTNATGNYTEPSNDNDICKTNEPPNEPVLFNASPSRKQPVSSFRLPKRTPVECIREHGPRSPVREYSSKLGLPNKPIRHTSPPPPCAEPDKEIVDETSEKPVTDSQAKGKSPKKKKSAKLKGEQITGENVEGSEDLANQNISENKTTSDSGTAINKASHGQHSSITSPRSRIESPRVHRVKYTKRAKNKLAYPMKEYTTSSTTDRSNTANPSFYRNFLGISPRAQCTRRPTDLSRYKDVPERLQQQSPNHSSKRTRVANSPVPYHRSRSISPMHIGKIAVPCSTPKGSPVTSITSILQRKQYSASKVPAPIHSENVSVLYNERSFFMESHSGQTSSSKRTRKAESPHMLKVEKPMMIKLDKPTDRGYQDLFIESNERAYGQIPHKKATKTDSPKYAMYCTDGEDTDHFPSDCIVQRDPRKSRSSSPNEKMNRLSSPHERRTMKNRERMLGREMYELDCQSDGAAIKSKTPTTKIKTLSTEMNALRDEIAALLNDSQDNLQDEDSLKTDTTDCTIDAFGPVVADIIHKPRQRTPERVAPRTINAEKPPLPTPIKKPVALLVSPVREQDGSTSVDCVYISGYPERIIPLSRGCYQKCTIDCLTPRESSVDPKRYDTVGESCVDPANFHSDLSLQCCHFHTKSSPDHSNNHYGMGYRRSSSVDSGRVTNEDIYDSQKNFSNNYNTIDDTKSPINDRGDAKNKKSTTSSEKPDDSKCKKEAVSKEQEGTTKNEKAEVSNEESGDVKNKKTPESNIQSDSKPNSTQKQYPCPKSKLSITDVSFRSIVNKIQNEICSNYYGIGFNVSSSVDGDDDDDDDDVLSSAVDGSTSVDWVGTAVDPELSVNNSNINVEIEKAHDNFCDEEDGNDGDEPVTNEGVADEKSNCDGEMCQTETKSEQIPGQTGAASAETMSNDYITSGNRRIVIDVSKDGDEQDHSDTTTGTSDSTDPVNPIQKPSLLQDLLSNSGVKWQKVGTATETDIRILRIAKAALMTTANDKAEACPYNSMLKSDKDDRESISDPSKILLKPKEEDGEEKSILSRINDF